MLFPQINLHKVLIKERKHQQHLLNQASELLNAATKKDNEIINRLKGKIVIEPDDASFLEETENVFSIREIQSICIRYRLRFLDSSYFHSDYPYAAIAEINAFEKKYGKKINSFRIIAPSEAFELENINKDPLLFAQINENTFYLIYQWGKDLAWYRRILTWPLQNLKTLIITLSVVCFLFAFSLPSSIMHIFNLQSEIYLRIWLTIHTFIGLLGMTFWMGLAFDKTFSANNWDSKYYNY